MKFLKKVILTTLLLFVFLPANAEDKLVYLDMSLMMSKSLAGQSIQKQLENVKKILDIHRKYFSITIKDLRELHEKL